ncbi:MAG: hypothetical protein ACKVTZ_22225, partial [Bacteroidia bacterium]
MQLTNSLHPSELFRYVHLRGARKPAQATLIEYVSYPPPPPSSERLYARLLPLKGSTSAFSDAKTECQAFREGDNYLASSEQIAERLPKLKDLYHAACSTLSYQEGAVTEAERILGSSLSNYRSTYETETQKEILWDNLVYQVIMEEKLELISSFTGYLVILNFLEQFAKKDKTSYPDLFRYLQLRQAEPIYNEKNKNLSHWKLYFAVELRVLVPIRRSSRYPD